LSELQEKFGQQSFTVLAFPTNDYGQEFLENKDIQNFVRTNYPQVTFPVLGTSHLPDNPVYQHLQRQIPDAHVRHNFYKYLVNRQGVAVKFYDKKTEPLAIQDDIEELLTATSDEVSPRQFVTQ
jgi:glutathione peroxidase